MVDHLTSEQRSRAMKRVSLKNGSLERLVQVQLRAMKLRFRCHDQSLPGSPDIVLHSHRVAIFVDGDFWHGWRLPSWEHKLSDFWREKIRTNRRRDRRNFRRLRALGWKVIRIWQHELHPKSGDRYLRRIVEALNGSSFRQKIRDLKV